MLKGENLGEPPEARILRFRDDRWELGVRPESALDSGPPRRTPE